MHCPFCGAQDTRVCDSRLASENNQIRRRRECVRCAVRFTTFERAELQLPKVVKVDGAREDFNEDKVRAGIQRALEKRPVSADEVELMLNHICRKLMVVDEREVASRRIGEMAMDELQQIDHIAYVRFASVYRDFKDVREFTDEVERLKKVPVPELRDHQLDLLKRD